MLNKKGVQDGVQDVGDWLSGVKDLDDLISAKQIERDRLMAIATNCTPELDGMPHGSNVSDKVGNIAVKLADMAREINDLIDYYLEYKRNVTKALQKLPNIEHLVLHKYYIQGQSYDDIAKDLGYCRQQIWRIKTKALQNLEVVTQCC